MKTRLKNAGKALVDRIASRIEAHVTAKFDLRTTRSGNSNSGIIIAHRSNPVARRSSMKQAFAAFPNSRRMA
jgi:hypothetical protein